MNLNEFQECMAEKSPKEKLLAMIEQMDNYAADKANAADARWRQNYKEADYWQRETQAMMERILWLGQEVTHHLPDPEDDYPVCMCCGKKIDHVRWLAFNHDGSDSWYSAPIHYDKPTGSVSIRITRSWTGYDDDPKESYTETILCPYCEKHPFDTNAGAEFWEPLEIVMWIDDPKEDAHGMEHKRLT